MKRIKHFALNRRVRKFYITKEPACCQRLSNEQFITKIHRCTSNSNIPVMYKRQAYFVGRSDPDAPPTTDICHFRNDTGSFPTFDDALFVHNHGI